MAKESITQVLNLHLSKCHRNIAGLAPVLLQWGQVTISLAGLLVMKMCEIYEAELLKRYEAQSAAVLEEREKRIEELEEFQASSTRIMMAQYDRLAELEVKLQTLRAAFRVNMLRCHPEMSHEEIDKQIQEIMMKANL